MRIAIYHGNFASVARGGEVAALDMARVLRELGHEVDLYASLLDRDVLRLACEGASQCLIVPE